jgi:hypothetical protein
VITALVAFEALDGMRPVPRIVAGALVALPYLAAAYLAQEAFKEPIEALFLLSFALLLPRATGARRAVPLGVIAAGAVYVYSFPGLFWLAGTAGIWLLALWWRRRVPDRKPAANVRDITMPGHSGVASGRHSTAPLLAAAAAMAAVLLILAAADLGRIVDFGDFRAFKSATIGGGLGNLRHQVSPLEALGIWPASDFRLSASDASGPTAVFYVGAAVAAAALAVALPRWIRRHGAAVPAAVAAAIVIYLGARLFGTVYTSAKALAIAAPLVTLISLGGLLEREREGAGDRAGGEAGAGVWRRGRRGAGDGAGGEADEALRERGRGGVGVRAGEASAGFDGVSRLAPARASRIGHRCPLLRRLLALALVVGMVLSSFLVLRQAPVAPTDHADQLAELRPLVEGHDVLFLGRDNFVAYELRGARPFTAVRNYYDPNYVKPDLRLEDVFQKFDFDSVTAETLDRFPFVITTRAAYASGPPPAFQALRETRDFVLWKRAGPAGPRRTLAEGGSPGAVLDCRSREAQRLLRAGGSATVFSATPVVGGRWSPSASLDSGSPASQTLALPAGRWDISIQYDATRPLHVAAPGLEATLPANLDYRGSVPYYPAGQITVRRGGAVRFTVGVERPPLAGRLLGTKSQAHLGAIAATRSGRGPRSAAQRSSATAGGPAASIPGEAERQTPLSRSCGHYVDWYRAGVRLTVAPARLQTGSP